MALWRQRLESSRVSPMSESHAATSHHESTRDMSIPVDQSGPATKAASSSQDQVAGGGHDHDVAMDVQGDGGGVGGKTSGDYSKQTRSEETPASGDEASGPACPLFMSGLPSDFASNPSLAAIASLLGDEEYDSDVDVSKVRKGLRQGGQDNNTASVGGKAVAAAAAAAKPRAGGGKVGGAGAARRHNKSVSKKKTSSHHRPYPTSDKKKGETKQKATVGEAQLFLNMWKL